MNSPVDPPFPFLHLDKNSSTPIYLQLVDEIIHAIQLGHFVHGYQLPGTRQFAKDLGLNRNTVVKSLEELAALGWIDILLNKGTYIRNQSQKIAHLKTEKNDNRNGQKAGFPIYTSYLLDQEKICESALTQLHLNQGLPDPRLVQYHEAYKTYHHIAKRKIGKPQQDTNSHRYFIKQILNYLALSRQMYLHEDQIHFVSNRALALHLISKLLFQPADQIGVHSMNEQFSNLIFQTHGIKLYPIQLSENGFDFSKLEEMMVNASTKAIYLLPLHLYPTAQPVSPQSLKELVALAKEHQIALIEDEPYASFYYTHRPLPSINAQFPNDQTITLGQIGDGLPSLFHLNYIVGPSDFIVECKKLSSIYEEALDPFLLETASTLIKEGELLRIERKHRKIYRERRERLGNRLRQTFGDSIQLQMPLMGLGLWLEWKIPLNLLQLKKDAFEKGLVIPQHLLYQTKKLTGIRIGFGTLNDEEIDQVVDILSACVDLQIKKLRL
ncbi:PLP-dependent aminotransferase family protein [Faecalibacter sp. LW9]|uniref:aminotransferase-like domain-containing protein n=1 Tax=Faecalibacter sp. LW9 TaxID=3103144 RepID=UPI002AFE2FAE|nr:PLP-dependent aminotransferase family protein [Faecalibacter sp. LW9]